VTEEILSVLFAGHRRTLDYAPRMNSRLPRARPFAEPDMQTGKVLTWEMAGEALVPNHVVKRTTPHPALS
jgi:hypothetical protein